MKEVLRFSNVTVEDYQYGGLTNATFSLYEGETVALAGLYDSGTKTIIRLLQGRCPQASGIVYVHGTPVRADQTQALKKSRVAVIGDQPLVYDDMSVLENISLSHGDTGLWRVVDHADIFSQLQELFAFMGIDAHAHTLNDFSTFEKKKVEILKAYFGNARIMLFSAVSQYCNEREAKWLSDIFLYLNALGVSVVLEYDSFFKYFQGNVSRCITVVHGSISKTVFRQKDGSLDTHAIDTILTGKQLKSREPVHSRPQTDGKRVLTLRDKAAGGEIDVLAGQVTGIHDSRGRIPSELEAFLAYADSHYEAFLDGKRICAATIHMAVRQRIAVITRNRSGHVVFSNLSPAENVCILMRHIWNHPGLYNRRVCEYLFRRVVGGYEIFEQSRKISPVGDCRDITIEAEYELMIAKWLVFNPRVVVMFSPLGYNDLQSRARYTALQRTLAQEGKAVLVISANVDDLSAACDEIHTLP